jgi:adenine-specific DNA-methyltransferase
MNEVFGEENFVEIVTVVRSKNGMGSKEGFSTNSDFVLCYKIPTDKHDQESFFGLPQTDDYVSKFDREDKHGKYKMDGIFRKKGQGQRRVDSPGCYYPVFYDANGVVYLEDGAGRKSVTPELPDGSDGRWVWSPEYAKSRIHRLYASPGGTVYVKDYWTSELREKPKSVFDKNQYTTEVATEEIKTIFGDKAFDTVKPVQLLSDLISNCCETDGIVLDFFAGSGTTAHAVFDQNLIDGANRKFILVQLPEPTESSEYRTIADLTKERVRRVINGFNEDAASELNLAGKSKEELGFRVFKLDQSNFMGWDAGASTDAEALGQQLDLSIDHVRQGRSEDDLLYELLLKSGFPLTTPVEKLTLAGKSVFSIGGGVFLICLERELTSDVIKAMAEMKPSRVVCLDDGFRGNDQLKTNAVLTFKAKGVAKFQTV